MLRLKNLGIEILYTTKFSLLAVSGRNRKFFLLGMYGCFWEYLLLPAIEKNVARENESTSELLNAHGNSQAPATRFTPMLSLINTTQHI